MDPQIVTLILGGLTAVATVAAAVTAVVGPRQAAKYTVELQEAKEDRDRKFQVFMILMAHRENYGQPQSMQALNVIDVLWRKNRTVKDAWSEMYRSLKEDGFTLRQKEERFGNLLSAIANDLGLQGDITNDEFKRYYYSTAAGMRENAEFFHHQATVQAAQEAMRQQRPPEGAPVGEGALPLQPFARPAGE